MGVEIFNVFNSQPSQTSKMEPFVKNIVKYDT